MIAPLVSIALQGDAFTGRRWHEDEPLDALIKVALRSGSALNRSGENTCEGVYLARIGTDLGIEQVAYHLNPNEGRRMAGGRVASVGDSCIDAYLGGRAAVGGNALNVAVNLARLGLDAEYIGVIGDDTAGARIRAALMKSGVRAERLHVRTGSSWVSYISVRADGIAVVDHEDIGVAGPYAPTSDELDEIAGYRHVHFANLADPFGVLSAVAQGEASTSYDFGVSVDDRSLGPMDVAFFSYTGTAGSREARDIARRAVQRGARVAVVTMGANGSLADDGERVHIVPAEPIRAVDTLGAGDNFIASFIARRLDGGSIADAMDSASRAAARTCLHWAAWRQGRSRSSTRAAQ